MSEEWRTIPDLPHYEISNYGRCRRASDAPYGVRKGFLLRPGNADPKKALIYKMYPPNHQQNGITRTIKGLMNTIWPEADWNESEEWMLETINWNDRDNKLRKERGRYKLRKPKEKSKTKHCICGAVKTNAWMRYCMKCSKGVEITARVREPRVRFEGIETGVYGLDCNDPLFNPFPT
jgi:hypothetical protein